MKNIPDIVCFYFVLLFLIFLEIWYLIYSSFYFSKHWLLDEMHNFAVVGSQMLLVIMEVNTVGRIIKGSECENF